MSYLQQSSRSLFCSESLSEVAHGDISLENALLGEDAEAQSGESILAVFSCKCKTPQCQAFQVPRSTLKASSKCGCVVSGHRQNSGFPLGFPFKPPKKGRPQEKTQLCVPVNFQMAWRLLSGFSLSLRQTPRPFICPV